MVTIEGLEPEALLTLSAADLDTLVLTGEPVAFRAGSAEVLGQFEILDGSLTVELAHIDGGGEGVLLTLAVVARDLAKRRHCRQVDWLVYATNCSKPNPKLKRVLVRRGFAVRDVPGKGVCYQLSEPIVVR